MGRVGLGVNTFSSSYLNSKCFGKDHSFHTGTIFVVLRTNLGGDSIFSLPLSTQLRCTPPVVPTVPFNINSSNL